MKTVFMLLVMLDDAARHKEWMDEAQDLKEDLREALQAKSRAKSAEPAARLVQIGEQEEEYWRKAKLVDIVKLAQKNLEAARDVAAAAKDGFFDEALLAFGRLESTCRNCHDVHPEKRLLLRSRRATGTGIAGSSIAGRSAVDIATVGKSDAAGVN